jgi:hypothetical protein
VDGGGGFVLGAACSEGTCGEGFCITQTGLGWPGGYCSTRCGDGCPQGGICYEPFDICLTPCAGGCRSGYTCSTSFGADALDAAACVPGSPSGQVGSACADNGVCPVGGLCLSEASSGWPGGYCTVGCVVGQSGCGPGATCFDLDGGGDTPPLCLDGCASDTECRPGYVCETTYFGRALPSASCIPGTRIEVAVGAPCGNAGQCPPSWFCLGPEDGFQDGYCSRFCGAGTPACPGDSFCQAGLRICLDGCAQSSDCRQPFYACHNRIAGITTAQKTCVPYNVAAHVGDPCQRFSDCTLGGFCIAALDENGDPTGFNGGYCSAFCGGQLACPSGSFCQPFGDRAACIDACDPATDSCRTSEGYACTANPAGQLGCFPAGGP